MTHEGVEQHRPASDACVLETLRDACVKEGLDPDLLSIKEDGRVAYVGYTPFASLRRETLTLLAFDCRWFARGWAREVRENPTGVVHL